MKVSNNTMKIGREYGYYNAVDCFRLRPLAEVLADLSSGKHIKDLRAKFDAAGVTAEDYT